MITFLFSIVVLVVGFFIYGKLVENVFGASSQNQTPASRLSDGVDFVSIPWHKAFLIQLLNIAGLGPIFGAIMGALFGPIAFIWIVLGSLFAGATHDYLSGMMSVRNDGKSISELVGIYLGKNFKKLMIVFSVILLVFVGTVFMAGPAKLLVGISPEGTVMAQHKFWLTIIIAYYFIATMVPIDKIIGKIYPLFGAALLFMAFGIAITILIDQAPIPELTLANLHPKSLPVWPILFITIACGAVSGFHATQSPLMARCISSEKEGRNVFYGAMIAEGVIALIWAAAAMSFFPQGIDGLNAAIAQGGPAFVVEKISYGQLGIFGGILAVIGVIVAPITSGDTAFRSARLIIADALKLAQGPIKNRFLISIPLLAIGVSLTFVNFSIIWRYFAWSNQALATIALWTGASYLAQNKKFHWIATIPATFMTAVVTTYILVAKEGFKVSSDIASPVGLIIAILALIFFLYAINKRK